MNKIIKKIAVEFQDGTKQIIWQSTELKNWLLSEEFLSELEKKPELPKKKEFDLKNITAHVIKIESERPSHRGGLYQRHYFRDITDVNKMYILDVTKFSSGVFKHLKIGDTLTNLHLLKVNNKTYIQGKCTPEIIGVWKDISWHFNNKVGFTL